MNASSQTWTEFLNSEGAVFTANGESQLLRSFGDASPGSESSVENWLTDLADLAVIEASGSECGDFLQAQFCNDVAQLAVDGGDGSGIGAQLNGYCNPKGRLLALFHLLALQADPASPDAQTRFQMIVPGDLAPSFIKRLSMFVLRADVPFTQRDDGVRVFGLGGPSVLDAVAGLFPAGHPPPDADDYASEQNNGLVLLKLPADRWMLVVPGEQLVDTWAHLAKTLQPVGRNRWTLASIDAGEPALSAQTMEQVIPQMLNMQAIDALSFKKGCYPGQEIVARMQYLGKLKRRMHRLSITMPEAPAAGAKFSADADADAGMVISAAETADGIRVLAVLKDAVDPSQLELDGAGNLSTDLLALPYTLEDTSASSADAGAE